MNSKFKVIAMGRVGTLALNRFINSHPQISLPAFKESTRLFMTPGENVGDLLNDRSQQSTMQGMIIHDAVFFDKQHRKDLLKMNNIKVESILHAVRNPFEQALSWINHINASACSGISNFRRIPYSAASLNENYPHHFQTMLSGLQCNNLYKNHKRVKIIDFQSLRPSNIDQTMASIYDFLGVDNSYRSEMFHKPQNNYTRELLTKGIEFKLNNEVIEMSMVPEDLFFHHEKGAKPWVTIHDTAKIYALCPSLPVVEGNLLFLPKSSSAVDNLSFKTRKMLHEGIADIVSQVVPIWAKNAEEVAQKIEAEKLIALSGAEHDFIAKMMKDDLDIFYRYHPEFKTLWKF
jgi:hypothetical protein